jgi:hypothetical protein
MDLDITVDDPKANTKPWTIHLDEGLYTAGDLPEYFCAENNRDASHLLAN